MGGNLAWQPIVQAQTFPVDPSPGALGKLFSLWAPISSSVKWAQYGSGSSNINMANRYEPLKVEELYTPKSHSNLALH
jgi:hypothetical protein